MAILTKEQILGADRKRTVDVAVPEWGGDVRLQELSASERDLWENESFIFNTEGDGARFNPRHVRARLVVRCLVDEAGRRLFSDDEVAAVGSLSASSVNRLFEAARKLNAIRHADIKELEGNSGAGPSAGNFSICANASA